MVETVELGSTSIIFFPLSFPFSSSDSVSEYASHLEAFILATWPNTCVVSGALMELAPLSRFLLRLCSVSLCLQLWKVFLSRHALAVSLVLLFGGTFPLLWIRRSKVSLFLSEFFAQFWQHTDMPYQARRCRGTPFPPKCICADNCVTSAPMFL